MTFDAGLIANELDRLGLGILGFHVRHRAAARLTSVIKRSMDDPMNPIAKKLLEDLRARVAGPDIDPALGDLLRQCISYVQSTADPENQPSQYGTTLVSD